MALFSSRSPVNPLLHRAVEWGLARGGIKKEISNRVHREPGTTTTDSLRVFLLMVFLLFFVRGLAHGQIRVAISADKETEAIDAVITAKLSNDSDLVLLDRANLDLLEGERSLGATSERAKESNAEILVFIEKVPDTQTPLISLRIIEVDSATVLLHRLLPDDGAATASADAIASIIRTAGTLAGSPGSGGRTSMALLGLRFEIPQTDSSAREFALNQLVVSRLHQHGGIKLLERWQSEALLFERISKVKEDLPLDGGAILVDGTLSENAGKLVVSLRVRRPTAPEGERVEIEQAGNDLGAMSKAIAKAIIKAAGASPVSVPPEATAEATLFGELASWSLTNGLAEEAVAAAETAVALSPEDPKLVLRRAQSHAFRAWPRQVATDFLDYRNLIPTNFDPASRLRSAIFSLELLSDLELLVKASGAKLDAGSREEIDTLSVRLLHDALCVIRRTYDEGREDSVPSELSRIRSLVRQKVEELAASPLLETRTNLCYSLIQWVSAYSENPRAAFASMKFLLGVNLGPNEYRRDPLRMALADGLFQEFGDHGDRQYVLTKGKLLLSSKTRETDRKIWLELCGEMANAPSARDRITAQTLRAHLLREDREALNQVLAEFADLVWEERVLLTEDASFLLASAQILFTELCHSNASPHLKDFNRRFLTDLLANRKSPLFTAIAFFGNRQITWTTEDATELLTLIEARRQSLVSDARHPTDIEQSIRVLQHQLAAAGKINSTSATPPQPQPAPSVRQTSADGALVVRELIAPNLSLRPHQGLTLGSSNVIQDETGEFWLKESDGIIRFRPGTPEPPKFLLLPGRQHRATASLAVGPEHIVVAIGNEVWIADKNEGNWWVRAAVPSLPYSVFGSGGRFYLVYRPKKGHPDHESGIFALDPATQSLTVVTSSRREPKPGSPDGRPDWIPEFVFTYGKEIVVVGETALGTRSKHEVFVRGENAGDWRQLLQKDGLISSSFTNRNGDSVLLFGGGGVLGSKDLEQAIRFPVDGTKPELLIGWEQAPPENPFYSNDPVLPGAPQFRLPPSLREPVANHLRKTSLLLHDERLFLVTVDIATDTGRMSSNQMLHVLGRDGASHSFPLKFQLQANFPNRDQLSEADQRAAENPNPVPGNLFAADNALYIGVNTRGYPTIAGFWRIPFADINAAIDSPKKR